MEPRHYLQGNSSQIESLNDTTVHIEHGNGEAFVDPQQDTSCLPSVNYPTKETPLFWAALTALFQCVFRGLIVSWPYYFCSNVPSNYSSRRSCYHYLPKKRPSSVLRTDWKPFCCERLDTAVTWTTRYITTTMF